MFLLRAVLNIFLRNVRPRRRMCVRCLLFSLSGPCELLFLLCFIALYVLCYPFNGSVCFVCCVYVNCLVKQFAICWDGFVILLLNVMELLCVGGGVLLDRPCLP